MERCTFPLRAAAIAAVLAWVGGGPALGQPASGDSLRSSWECLPEGTIAAFRIPDGRAALKALRETTKWGAVFLAEDRIAGLQALLASQDWWEPFQDDLERYGLSVADLPQVLAGESGFAAVLPDASSGGRRPEGALAVGLAWVQPGDDLALRLWRGVQQAIEDHRGDEPAVTRLDLDIAGRPAMLLTVPQEIEVSGGGGFALPDNLGELDEEQRAAAIRRALEEADWETETEVRYFHVLLAERRGRLLLAFPFVPVEDARDRRRIDRLTAVFERFVAAHEGRPESFVSRIEATPGVRDALPQEGVPVAELVADLHLAIHFAATADPDVSPEELDERFAVLKSIGIDRLGVLAGRVSLVESALHTGMFLEVPRPRTGLLTLLDDPPVEAKPPRWVPASVVQYGHLSLDLGHLYSLIKELIIQQAGDVAEEQFERIEAGAKGFAGADMGGILSSLGRQHVMIQFPPKLDNLDDLDEETPFSTMDRTALVWTVRNEEIWKRLLAGLRTFAAMTEGAVEFGEEQGFSGYRLNAPGTEAGLFLGKGYLVLAVGEGVLAQTLSVLNHPPEGRDALINGEVHARAAELLPLEPGLAFELTDGKRYTEVMQQMLVLLLDTSSGPFAELHAAEGEEHREMIHRIRRLMPSADEWRHVIGVVVSLMRATEHGLEVKGVTELPPP